MALQGMPTEDWQEFVRQRTEALPDRSVADVLSRVQLVPLGNGAEGVTASVHNGDFAVDGDLTPLSQLSVFDGDLLVRGKLSTRDIDDGDGHATLIVFGNLRCNSIDHDWASIMVVTGDVIVDEWVFAAREDSSLIVGGDFRTPIFIGADIWVSVGGSAEMEYGSGYAVALASFDDAYGALQIRPQRSWQELAAKLGLGREQVREEYELLEFLEDRLRETGSMT